MGAAQESRRQELDELAAEIRYHEAAYRAGTPEITDAVFDEIFDRYQALADALKIPTNERIDTKPGDEHSTGFETVEHRIPMLSLDKLSPNRRDSHGQAMPLIEQLRAWYERRLKDLEVKQFDLVTEPKIDGVSISLLYEAGALKRAVTRGDGLRGDIVTEQVRYLRALPEKISEKKSFELRGELYWPLKEFHAYNAKLKKNEERTLINPRNGCAGMIKRKNPTELEGTGIEAFAYQVAWSEGVKLFPTQHGVLKWLAELGFGVYLSEVHQCQDYQSAFDYCERYTERRSKLPYEIDGLVIKIDALKYYAQLGATEHHPEWGIAYKFPPERKLTRLNDILVSVGKSGKLTPIAMLEPVFLAGTTVSRASLHNFVELERKDVRIGDSVWAEKAGEIIPQVIGVDYEKRPRGTRKFKRPEHCPSCDSEVLSEEIFIYCPNPACPDQVRERLRHFASRGAMDIEGLGPALIDQLVEQHGVRAPDDLFKLSAEQLAELERMGEKSAKRVLEGVEKAKTRGLARVLNGLAIRHVGEAMADELARYFGDIDALLDFAKRYVAKNADAIETIAPDSASKRGAIEGLARKSADSIFKELNSRAVRKVFQGFQKAGVSLKAEKRQVKQVEGVAGKIFVLTGTLPTLGRKEATQLIKDAGGRVAGSVSKKTDYVVAGSEAGSKLDDAKTLDIPIIDEDKLRALLE